jgi:serine/threonine protein kinase
MVHGSLQHPGIVRYEGFYEDEYYFYILLEFCSQGSLWDLLSARGRFSEPEVRTMMLQILDAVEYMHSKNIIHRDLKLGNIFFARRASVENRVFRHGGAARRWKRAQAVSAYNFQ